MKCSQIQEKLPLLLYGDLDRNEATDVRDHLAQCDDCKTAFDEFSRLRELLNVSPASNVLVDVGRISAESIVIRTKTRSGRWKKVVLAATAGVILLAFAFNIEIRIDDHQLAVRWGSPPTAHERESVIPNEPKPMDLIDRQLKVSRNLHERICVLDELVHALADEVDSHGRRQSDSLSTLQTRLTALEQDSRTYREQSNRSLAALYTAYFQNDSQGENP